MFGRLVYELDGRLRQRQGVFEYTSDPDCLFRIQRASAATHVELSDGTQIDPGDPILDLHLWNEQMPEMDREITMAWARQLSRAIQTSLRELASYLAHHPELDDVVALRADMRLGSSERTERLTHLSARYGFEKVDEPPAQDGLLHQFGENIFLFLLLVATNPASLRTPVFWRDHTIAYLSRKVVEERYGKRRASSRRPIVAEERENHAAR